MVVPSHTTTAPPSPAILENNRWYFHNIGFHLPRLSWLEPAWKIFSLHRWAWMSPSTSVLTKTLHDIDSVISSKHKSVPSGARTSTLLIPGCRWLCGPSGRRCRRADTCTGCQRRSSGLWKKNTLEYASSRTFSRAGLAVPYYEDDMLPFLPMSCVLFFSLESKELL